MALDSNGGRIPLMSGRQKADLALQARKKALVRQKETERKQVENLNRKHLAGLRVVQKNLVYVVGLSPKSREEDLLQTLRGDQYFGQYGKIIKIVVSKAKEGTNGNNSIGVYVTFARKEDAASCIAAVDGSQNGDRVLRYVHRPASCLCLRSPCRLRAQYGTTKYCSAYLRNEPCSNRNCMFLHETGEDLDSFSRQDLSSINAVSTQRSAPSSSSPASSSKSAKQPPQPQPPQPQPPPQQAPQVVTAAFQPTRQASRDEPMSRSDSGDGSALPSSASWAAKNAQNDSRKSSKPASVSAPSPVVTTADLPFRAAENETINTDPPTQEFSPAPSSQPQPTLMDRLFSRGVHPLDRAMKTVLESSFKFTFDRTLYTDDVLQEIDAYPPLFDANGGLVRYRLEQERDQERLKHEEEERSILGPVATAEEDENPASGSLQLGGEPETKDEPSEGPAQINSDHRNAIQPPYPTAPSNNLGLVSSTFLGSNSSALSFSGRSLTPQQQQQLSFLRSYSNHQSPVNGQFQPSYSGNTSLHHHQQSNPFQSQNLNLSQIPGLPGHARQASRYNFANDSVSASTANKPTANAQLLAQQAAMMPTNQGKHFQSQPMPQSGLQHNHFYSGVHGPPPGLKSSGTPPISGGGMFGQGHGFASAMGGSLGLSSGNVGSKNSNEELMRELLRGRGGNVNSQGPDVGKREFRFPSSIHPPTTSSAAPASGLLSSLYGAQLDTYNGYQDHSIQKQKKKGKKHRHANTSSSGGGGIVDLADPSILQARMHHTSAGQGQYTVQGQGGYNSNSMIYGSGYGSRW